LPAAVRVAVHSVAVHSVASGLRAQPRHCWLARQQSHFVVAADVSAAHDKKLRDDVLEGD
jgi:hypothetical protein